MAAGSHGVSLTSYNEWGEGTQLEPAQPWTDPETQQRFEEYEGGPHHFMQLTKKLATMFKEALAAGKVPTWQSSRTEGGGDGHEHGTHGSVHQPGVEPPMSTESIPVYSHPEEL